MKLKKNHQTSKNNICFWFTSLFLQTSLLLFMNTFTNRVLSQNSNQKPNCDESRGGYWKWRTPWLWTAQGRPAWLLSVSCSDGLSSRANCQLSQLNYFCGFCHFIFNLDSDRQRETGKAGERGRRWHAAKSTGWNQTFCYRVSYRVAPS